MCPFDPPGDLNAQREAIVALWHERQKLAAENEELRKKLAARQVKATKGGKNKSERRGRTGHVPPKAPDPPETREGHGPTPQPHLPVDDKPCALDEADLTCPCCDGGQLHEWAEHEELAELIEVVERQFRLQRLKKKKYRCRKCGHLEVALGPDKVVPGGRYSLNFAVEVAHDKYLLHSPLERQAREMTRQGLVIDSQTLWDQTWALCQALVPTYHALHRYVLSGSWVSADETTWQVMRHAYTPKDLKVGEWYAWVAHRPDAAVYLLRPTRDEHAAADLLRVTEPDATGRPKLDANKKPVGELYQGKVMCDGWWAYKWLAARLPALVLAHCWAHARREFVEAQAGFAEQANAMLDLIAELYAIEKKAPPGSAGDEKRRVLRQTESRAVLGKIEAWVWANALQAPAQSSLRQACVYLGNQWAGLCRFVDDARLPLDNNATEQDCRQPVLGKANHQGSKSKRGLEAAEIFYSLGQSAKLCGVEPKAYLRLAAVRAVRGWSVVLPHEVEGAHLQEALGMSEEEAGRVLARKREKEGTRA